jgi:hypothetical protein
VSCSNSNDDVVLQAPAGSDLDNGGMSGNPNETGVAGPPPGWYPLRSVLEGAMCWWNGVSWTDRVIVPTASPKNRPGIVGLLVGLVDLGFMFFLMGVVLGPLGITFGIIGLRQEHHGRRGVAVAAVVLGLIGTLMGLVWIAMTSDPDFEM